MPHQTFSDCYLDGDYFRVVVVRNGSALHRIIHQHVIQDGALSASLRRQSVGIFPNDEEQSG